MGDEGFAVQASYKFGPHGSHMVNVRGKTPEEFADNAQKVEQVANAILDLGQIFTGMPEVPEGQAEALLKEELGGRVVERVCPHGTMTLKSGATWEAWMCPAPKNDPTKCQPIDAKTGKAWPKR